MATQAPDSPTTQRAALVAVLSRMLAELRFLWPNLPRGTELQPTLRYDVLPAIARQYGEASAALAADWFDTEREALGVKGRFTAALAPQPGDDVFQVISNWAAAPAEGANPDLETALKRAEASSQKLVADMNRGTIQLSTARDPQARGWARFTEPGACDFCLMLSARGGVYTAETVKFGSHDHCHCLAGPVWDENRGQADTYKRSPRSDRHRAAANKLARRWIRDNLPRG